MENVAMADTAQRAARPVVAAVVHAIQATNAVDLLTAHLKVRNVAATAATATPVSTVCSFEASKAAVWTWTALKSTALYQRSRLSNTHRSPSQFPPIRQIRSHHYRSPAIPSPLRPGQVAAPLTAITPQPGYGPSTPTS